MTCNSLLKLSNRTAHMWLKYSVCGSLKMSFLAVLDILPIALYCDQTCCH